LETFGGAKVSDDRPAINEARKPKNRVLFEVAQK